MRNMTGTTTTSTMAPPAVPPRNPRRISSLKVQTKVPPRQPRPRPLPSSSNLSEHVCDVWEHAATLYHGYEWQESAETFLYLSRVIDRDLESTLCLLNSALVYARLGDYPTAAQVLDEAKHIDDILALTLFIMAHVQFQLGNLEKSQECFRFSLSTLKGSSLRLDSFGMSFTLRPSQIQDDLRIFYDVLTEPSTTLSALPADVIFEAPPRIPGNGTHTHRSSIDNTSLPELSEGSSSPSPLSPIERTKSADMEHSGVPLFDEPTNDYAECKLGDAKELAMNVFELETPSVRLGRVGRLALGKAAFTTEKYPVGARSNDSSRRPSFQAREARVQGDSVQELAGFIRDLPLQSRLQPRSGEAQYGDTQELADYFRAGPGIASDELLVRKKRKSSPHSSVYSDDLRADSVRSAKLSSGWDAIKARSSPLSPYRYRSGVGSALMHDSSQNSSRHSSQHSSPAVSPLENAETQQNPMDEFHRGHAEALHNLFSDSASQASWPLTDEAEGSLRDLSLNSRENSVRTYSPKGRSQLSNLARTPSQLSKTSIVESPIPDELRPTKLPLRGLSKLSKRPTSRLSSLGSKSTTSKSASKSGSIKSTFTFLNAFGH